LKYYKASEDLINYAKDIILDVLPLKDMNKLCTTLGIIVNISFVEENGHGHTPKKCGGNNTKDKMDNYNLISMFEHFMPNIIIDNARYEGLKAYDSNNNEIEFKVDK
jgi:hypothetical protein